MSASSVPSIRPDSDFVLPVNAGEMECSSMDDRRDDQQDEGQDEGGEESGEARAARRVPQPRSPSAEERRLHDLNHPGETIVQTLRLRCGGGVSPQDGGWGER